MRIIILSIFFVFCHLYANAQIVAGPMLGHQTPEFLEYWVMTKNASQLYVGKAGEGVSSITKTYSLDKEEINETFEMLLSGERIFQGYKIWKVKYDAKLLSDGDSLVFAPVYMDFEAKGKKVDFDKKEIAAISNHKYNEFLIGSCAYIGKGFSKVYRPWNANGIYSKMAKEDADYMLWMGDNIYLVLNHDMKNSQSIYKRYVGVRNTRQLNDFLTCGIEHYSTWDDHDFGPNNADGTFEGKEITTKIFNEFWCNPKAEGTEGIYYKITKGSAEIFMTDGRSFRNNDGSSMLGKTQLEWLKNGLSKSKAPFKIIVVGSQVIQKADRHESYADFPVERSELLQFLEREKIPGVIFFSGDRHHTEVAKIDRENLYPLYDITCSGMSSPRPKFRGWGPEGKSDNRVDDLFITRHNYAKCSISGPSENLKLSIEFKLANGNVKETFSVDMKGLGY